MTFRSHDRKWDQKVWWYCILKMARHVDVEKKGTEVPFPTALSSVNILDVRMAGLLTICSPHQPNWEPPVPLFILHMPRLRGLVPRQVNLSDGSWLKDTSVPKSWVCAVGNERDTDIHSKYNNDNNNDNIKIVNLIIDFAVFHLKTMSNTFCPLIYLLTKLDL